MPTPMKSLPLEEFISLAPDPGNGNIADIYKSPFRPEHVGAYFAGWEYDERHGLFVDHTEERNMVSFGAYTYFVNGEELRWPPTVNDFISDCRSVHVTLRWSEATADKLWCTAPDGAEGQCRVP